MTEIARLERWFQSACDGDWEHDHGIIIETLDNPGWSVTIDLAGTSLERTDFEPVKHNAHPTDWYTCRVEAAKFKGDGGVANLGDILAVFVTWAGLAEGSG